MKPPRKLIRLYCGCNKRLVSWLYWDVTLELSVDVFSDLSKADHLNNNSEVTRYLHLNFFQFLHYSSGGHVYSCSFLGNAKKMKKWVQVYLKGCFWFENWCRWTHWGIKVDVERASAWAYIMIQVEDESMLHGHDSLQGITCCRWYLSNTCSLEYPVNLYLRKEWPTSRVIRLFLISWRGVSISHGSQLGDAYLSCQLDLALSLSA